MKVSFYPEVDLASDARPAVTLGNFDGVHLGHQRIMKLLVKRGQALGVPTVAVTFEPHPISVLRPDVAPKRILTPEQKRELLGKTGIDRLLIIEFTLELSHQEPEAFVREVLFEKLRVQELVLGLNFRFGRGRAGDLETLRSFGGTFDFEVRRVEPALNGLTHPPLFIGRKSDRGYRHAGTGLLRGRQSREGGRSREGHGIPDREPGG
jgi:riboflavin kinase/FMN adenylyltransferase